MRFPRIGPTNILFALLAMLMISTLLYNRESLRFCEQALFGEMDTLRKEGTLKETIKFTEVCPEIRQRVETNTNKLLDIVLALLVPLTPHPPDRP